MPAHRSENFEVVMVGDGVIGCSIAYHLAPLGVGPVPLLERNASASGATSRAAAVWSARVSE
jgi:4-methylaminobutanoate oxidase (formaldehyde-forming)